MKNVKISYVRKWSWYFADPFCRLLVWCDFVTADQYAEYMVKKHMKIVFYK